MSHMGEIIPTDTEMKNKGSVPQVMIVIHGFEHNPFNLQAVSSISRTMHSSFQGSTNRERTLFLEMAGQTHAQAEDYAKKVIRFGGLWNACYRQLAVKDFGHDGAEFALDRYKRMLVQYDNETILQNNLVHNPMRHHLYKEIDSLKEQYSFDLRMEGHTRAVIQQMDLEEAGVNIASEKAKESFLRGNLVDAIKWRKTEARALNNCQFLRERELIRDLRTWMKASLKSPEGGVLVGIFGFNHVDTLFTPLQELCGDRTQLILKRSVPEDYPAVLIGQKAILGEEAEPVVYARSLFLTFAAGFVHYHYHASRRLSDYGLRYEIILNELIALANTLSYEEIERICKDAQEEVPTLIQASSPGTLSYAS